MDPSLQRLIQDPAYDGQLLAWHAWPGKAAQAQAPRVPLRPELETAMRAQGLGSLYRHQAQAIDALRAGQHVCVVTPTASGKTLCYVLPILESLLDDPSSKALVLYPIKALAQDQLGVFNEWLARIESSLPVLKSEGRRKSPERVALYDGDTSPSRRARLRDEPPAILLSNPDMLHLGLLPSHSAWGAYFARLKYVVVDEAHSYRGVFGAHIAMLLRRLRRICRFYGSDPRFIFLSATIANPGEFVGRLLGEAVEVIDQDGAPAGPRVLALWQPLASPYREATDIFNSLVREGRKTIAFTKARKITELMSLWGNQSAPDLKERVAAYRAGYLPEQRREIEQRLFSGQLDGVISTSALELGIDVGGLDACVLVGYPGTMISTRQRFGRVGRSGQQAVGVLVGLSDALDQYFLSHPDDFFDRPVERALLPLDNHVINAGHLDCAAAELPLEPADSALFGEAFMRQAESLWREGRLRLGAQGKYYASEARPSRHIKLRGSGETYMIETGTAAASRTLGILDVPRVYRDGHPGAIYLHQGAQYQVLDLDPSVKRVRVREVDVDYYTEPRGEDHVEILRVDKRLDLGDVEWCYGAVRASEQVTGYVSRQVSTQKMLGEYQLEMPLHAYETRASWWVLPGVWRKEFAELGFDFAGSIHALEHAQIAMLPLFVLCDRWDLGGVSYWAQPQLDQPAIFVYDGAEGGAALAEQGWDSVSIWMRSVEALLKDCKCEEGCPACVQSPKCGNGNRPLDRFGALELCRRLLARLDAPPPVSAGTKKELLLAPVVDPGAGLVARMQQQNGLSIPPEPIPARQKIMTAAARPFKEYDPNKDDIVVFDLETQFLAADVGGWNNKAAMKVSVAVLWSFRENAYRQYTEAQVPALLERLRQADLIIGFNQLGFDYEVLKPYGGDFLLSHPSLDLLAEVTKSLGHRLKLESLTLGTLNAPKGADGLQAVAWWREGKLAELLTYCQKDVEQTRDLWLFGRQNGHLLYDDRQGKMRVPADW